VIPHLTQLRLRIIVPDLLGYGGTSKPLDPELYNYRQMAEDVMEILDRERIDKIIPIGHDWGCYFCSRINMLYPERCVATVHIGIALLPRMTEPVDMAQVEELSVQLVGHRRFAYWKLFTSPEAPQIFADHLESVWYALHGAPDHWVYEMFCRDDAMKDFLLADRTEIPLKDYAQSEQMKEKWKQDMKTPGDWQAAFCWYQAFVQNVQIEEDKKLSPENAILKMPVLHIACDDDGVNPPKLAELVKQAGLIPNVDIKVLHAGHWCPYEKPADIAKLIVNFVEERHLL